MEQFRAGARKRSRAQDSGSPVPTAGDEDVTTFHGQDGAEPFQPSFRLGETTRVGAKRLQVVTVVDLLPAPPDSVRSVGRFTLATNGLKGAIRHRESGRTLFDVGTWDSHLTDQGPSPLDRQTARELAAERPPRSVLLIVTPAELHALMHAPARA